MEIVFENSFIKMRFDSANQLMESVWTTSIMMTQDMYRAVVSAYLLQIQEYHPAKVLVDYRNSEYVVVPEDQNRLNSNIYLATVQAGVSKMAVLVGTDFLINLSLEQTVEDSLKNEDIRNGLQQKFFEDYDTAKNWLLSE